MAQATLKISKGAYEAKILKLESCLNQLDTKVTQYETLKTNMTKFMDGSDDNYEKLKANVENNIKMVRKAREMTDASIKMLKETLKDAEEFGAEANKAISEAGELAMNTLKGAVEAMKLIDWLCKVNM